MITVAGRTRWSVLLTVARSGGLRDWAEVRCQFERALAARGSKSVAGASIDGESRRGRDYVKVKVTMTVTAVDIADVVGIAWRAFRRASGGDLEGWDTASAEAEVRPEGP
jgi:hypothetical protein